MAKSKGQQQKKKQKQGTPQKGKSKHKSKGNKSRQPLSGAGVTWGSKAAPKPEPTWSEKNFYLIIAGIFLLFLFCLWAFVDDRATIIRKSEMAKAQEKRRNETKILTEQRKEFSFEYSLLMNSTGLSQTLGQLNNINNDEMDVDNINSIDEDNLSDRIIVVVFDDATREADGVSTKVKLFRKFENIAKSLPRKKVFKRYEENELPLITLFNCGDPNDMSAESLCKQIIGEHIPNVVIFRHGQQPRALPNDYKSDNQIIKYFYDLMQPAVKYLEERTDCEAFVANDDDMNVLLFGDEKTGSFDQVADSLREFAKFGRTKNPSAADEFDTEMGSLMIWRTFGQNPIRFPGNISDGQAVHSFVMNNYLPVFGEFTPLTSQNYMKRGLPIVWIAFDRDNDDSKDLLQTVESIAYRHVGQLSFVQLDAKLYPQIAKNFNIDVSQSKSDDEDEDDRDRDRDDEDDDDDITDPDSQLPQVFIMNKVAQLRETIDYDNPQEAISKVINGYSRAVRQARGDGIGDLEDDTIQYDTDDEQDDEFEEDDEEEEDDDDDDEDENDEDDEQTQQQNKQDL